MKKFFKWFRFWISGDAGFSERKRREALKRYRALKIDPRFFKKSQDFLFGIIFAELETRLYRQDVKSIDEALAMVNNNLKKGGDK